MQNTTYNYFFRVDANEKIGTGHLRRSILISNELKFRGMKCYFILKDTPSSFTEKLQIPHDEIIFLNNSDETSQLIFILNKYSHPVLITDSDEKIFYNEDFQKTIISNGIILATITFYNPSHFLSHLVINPNVMAVNQSYSCENYTKLLLGPSYLPISKEFARYRDKVRSFTKESFCLLISFGGSDAHGVTCDTLQSLLESSNSIDRFNIVITSLFPYREKLKEIIELNKTKNINLYEDTNNMAKIMNESDISLSSGGLILWESLYLGIPSLVISTSERERISSIFLNEKGYIKYLGHYNTYRKPISNELDDYLKDSNLLNKLSSRGQELISDNGLKELTSQLIQINRNYAGKRKQL